MLQDRPVQNNHNNNSTKTKRKKKTFQVESYEYYLKNMMFPMTSKAKFK